MNASKALKQLVVLFSIAAFPDGVESICSLCKNGAAMSRPEYVLGLVDPIPLNTCQDLGTALLFIQEDSEMCQQSRALASLCGCPVYKETACSICGSGDNVTMARPQQMLDGLVELNNDRDSFGLVRTCALVESAINEIPSNSSECLDRSMGGLQEYCGCSNGEEEEEEISSVCSFCPGGEILPPIDDLLAFEGFVIFGGDGYSDCASLRAMAENTEVHSDQCQKIQSISTACGCPVPEDACLLCQDGELLGGINRVFPPSDKIYGPWVPDRETTCKTVNAALNRLSKHSEQCTELQAKYSKQCECAKKEEFIPCALCPHGESVPDPNKRIEGISGYGFDYVEHTCGAMEAAARTVDARSQICDTALILSKACGCTVPQDQCSICRSGQMAKPHAILKFAFGAENKIMREFSGGEDQQIVDLFNRPSSCEVGDSFLAHVFVDDEFGCYWNQFLRGHACGCPYDPQVDVVLWLQRGSGLLSLAGSLLIIVAICRRKPNQRWTTYNQIVMLISIFDSLSSTAYIFGTALTPTDRAFRGSIGNEATCGVQAFLFQAGFTSLFYNVALCAYFLLVVKYQWRESKFCKVNKWIHLGICSLGLGLAFGVIPFAFPDWKWCYLGPPVITGSILPGIFFFMLPIGLSIVSMTVFTILLLNYVRKIEGNTPRRLGGTNRPSLAKRTLWQSCWFLLVFYIVWPIQFIAFVVEITEDTYWLYVLAALLGPLQGKSVFIFGMTAQAKKLKVCDIVLSLYVLFRRVCYAGFLNYLVYRRRNSKYQQHRSRSAPFRLIWEKFGSVTKKLRGLGFDSDSSSANRHCRHGPEANGEAATDAGVMEEGGAFNAAIEAQQELQAVVSTSCHQKKEDTTKRFRRESDCMIQHAFYSGMLDDDEIALYHDVLDKPRTSASQVSRELIKEELQDETGDQKFEESAATQVSNEVLNEELPKSKDQELQEKDVVSPQK